MANLSGTNVAAIVVPFTTEDSYATHEDTYGRGGFRSVATLAERNAISTDRRKNGMFVYVVETDAIYKLLDNSWVEYESSGTSTATATFNAKFYTERFENLSGLQSVILSREATNSTLFINAGNTLLQQNTYTLSPDKKTITFDEEIEAGVPVEVLYIDASTLNTVTTVEAPTLELSANQKYSFTLDENSTITFKDWVSGEENKIISSKSVSRRFVIIVVKSSYISLSRYVCKTSSPKIIL